MPHHSPEEIKVRYLENMGDGLGLQFNELWQDVARLHVKWHEFVELFGTKSTRVDLLNQAAPTFFRIVQDTLWEDIVLHIARLTDPPKSNSRTANLSIRNLPDLVSGDDVKAKVEELVRVIKDKSEFCRDWRNRRIAHTDLALAIDDSAPRLLAASRLHVREALTAIVEALNEVARAHGDSSTHFDMPVGAGGALSLLYVIRDGLNAATARKERLKRREWTPDDLSQDREI